MLTPELRAGRRALEELAEFTLLRDWEWNEQVRRWTLHCRLSLALPANSRVSATSDWYLLVEDAYPWGSIKLYPARAGGITQTFQHQSLNVVTNEALPWRAGDICLDTTVRVLGRQGFDSEPYDADLRLYWRVARAIDWVSTAASGELVYAGDPFELPAFPTNGNAAFRLSFQEDQATFERWQTTTERAGLCDLANTVFRHHVVTSLYTATRRFRISLNWGDAIRQQDGAVSKGAWVRLDRIPILAPWQVPATWGELRQVFQEQGLSFDDQLGQVTSWLRDGRRHVLLIGFPIPERTGGPSYRMHWAGVRLPVLSFGTATVNGFRPNEVGYRHRDRREILSDDMAIEWLPSSNWADGDITARGQLPTTLRERPICLIGAGALGSYVAELLVRGGVRRLVVVDQDVLRVGNLVRHTLLLTDLEQPKATALARRLNAISPHVTVIPVTAAFPHLSASDHERVQSCDLVLDCTGDDATLYHLSQEGYWPTPRMFVSLSLGSQARRLFCFAAQAPAFPLHAFQEQIGPWLLREREETADTPFPREGIGCWHPVFPARDDDIVMMATFAVKHLIHTASCEQERPDLVVFEQVYEDGSCVGVRKSVSEVVGA